MKIFTKEISPAKDCELLKEELQQAQNFASQKRQDEFLCARAFLREIAKNEYGLNDISIVFDGPKPRLLGNEFHFSISHSKGFLAIATNTVPLGVDLECIDPKRDMAKIVKRFSSDIQKEFECAKEPTEYFYTLWTSYEAYIKLRGKSLAAKDFDFSAAKFETKKLENGFMLTVALPLF